MEFLPLAQAVPVLDDVQPRLSAADSEIGYNRDDYYLCVISVVEVNNYSKLFLAQKCIPSRFRSFFSCFVSILNNFGSIDSGLYYLHTKFFSHIEQSLYFDVFRPIPIII